MLTIHHKRSGHTGKIILTFVALLLLGTGLYVLSLVLAPNFPQIALKPIVPEAMAAPKANDNRIVIPKIGVSIPYGETEASLDRGAWWRYPERGDPQAGGNFIIAAHRFSIQPTPQGTIEKSPFYNIERLKKGDQILIDYKGVRYVYVADEFKDVSANAVEIEEKTTEPRLTLYSCELGGSKAGRVVVIAKPVGKATE